MLAAENLVKKMQHVKKEDVDEIKNLQKSNLICWYIFSLLIENNNNFEVAFFKALFELRKFEENLLSLKESFDKAKTTSSEIICLFKHLGLNAKALSRIVNIYKSIKIFKLNETILKDLHDIDLSIEDFINLNLNIQDNEGNTPLHKSISLRRNEVALLMIYLGADVNKFNFNRETALILATKKNEVAIVKSLIDKGAKKDIKDKFGLKALDYCNNEIIEFIIKFRSQSKINIFSK